MTSQNAPRAFRTLGDVLTIRKTCSTGRMTALKTDRSASSPSSSALRARATWRDGAFCMISVVSGLYGLNLIPLWRPKRITIFDINPPPSRIFASSIV